MNLPDMPIAHEGFFAARFVTAKDQEKSRDFYVRIAAGKLRDTDDYVIEVGQRTQLALDWLNNRG